MVSPQGELRDGLGGHDPRQAREPSPDLSTGLLDDADVAANIGRELAQLEKLLGG